MATTRKSVIYSALANFGSIGTSLVLVVIVTRWLEPAEIGGFAVAYAFINLLEPLRHAQMVAFVIKSEILDHALMRGVNFVAWVMTAAVLVIVGGIVAVLNGPMQTPEVGRLLAIMSTGFVATTLAQPALAVLSREMRFGLITSVDVAAGLMKAAVTIGLLYAGLRAEAMAWGIVAEMATKLALVFGVQRAYVFALPRWSNTRPIWDFGFKFTGAQLITRASIAASDIMVGRFLGLASAGIYNRATVLVRTLRSGIEGAVVPVAMAAFAKTNRDNRAQLTGDYLNAVSLLTGVTWSALAVFIALAEPLILTVYGPRWSATIPIAQVAAAGGMVFAATAMTPTLLASIGKVDSLFRRNMTVVVPRLAILAVTVQFSLMAVAWGAFASMVIAFLVNESLLRREFGITFRQLAAALWRSAVVAGTSALCSFGVLALPIVAGQSLLIQLAVALGATGVVWLATLLLVRHALLGELQNLLRRLRLAFAGRA